MNSRLASIIRKEFIQIFRDKRTLVIILFIPIMQLFLLGYSATNDIRNIPMAVVDQCQCAESRELLDAYRVSDYFKLEFTADSEDESAHPDRDRPDQGRPDHPTRLQHPPGGRARPRWPSSWMARMPRPARQPCRQPR